MYWEKTLLRLLIAVILGGIIGINREKVNRPAGFRTHILVCIGACLVMITSEFLTYEYMDVIEVDPTRMGAQVISGIGFLGAGTIIMKRGSVRGLTTAASLWAVACVGLAIGSGFYIGSIITTVLIYITLIFLRRIEKDKKHHIKQFIKVNIKDTYKAINDISEIIDKYDIRIKGLEKNVEEEGVILIYNIMYDEDIPKEEIIEDAIISSNINKIEFIEQ